MEWALVTTSGERLYRSLIENSGDIVMCYSADLSFLCVSPSISDIVPLTPQEMLGRTPAGTPIDYRYESVNPAFESLTGLKSEDILGRTVRETMPETEQYWIDACGHVAITGETVHIAHYVQALDRHYEVSAYRPAEGQFACIFVDTTEAIRTAERLRKSEDLFRALVELSSESFVVLKRDLSVSYASPTVNRVLGYAVDDALRHRLLGLIHPDDAEAAGEMFARACSGTGAEHFVLTIMHGDGDWRSVAGTCVNLLGQQPIDGVLVNFQDVTERRRATLEGWSAAIDMRDRETEGQAMKMHPVHAFDWLAPISFLRLAIDIPHYHHERWDGTGYPRGLKGDSIPLSARAFAIVDVWDALTSDMPYRRAWTEGRALEHIIASAGTHFDPAIVRAFVPLVLGKKIIRGASVPC